MHLQSFVCVLVGLLVFSCTLQTAVADSNAGKMKSMAEVLQILQNLDKYYSQAARPSYVSPAVYLYIVNTVAIAYYKKLKYKSEKWQKYVTKLCTDVMDTENGQNGFGKRTYPTAFEEHLFNGEEVPPETQPWERFIR